MSEPTLHRLGHDAMATHFAVTIAHEDAAAAGTAAQAFFDDVDRLEQELSRFVPWSDISRINGSPAGRVVDVHEATMDCLLHARDVWEATGGAFDVTIGPLFSILRWADGTPRKPEPGELETARARTGMDKLVLDPDNFTVTPLASDMVLDLGAIGKGYALDQGAIILREHGMENALLNAGTSTLLGIGAHPGMDGWLVRAGAPEPFELKNESVSGTGFEVKGAHVIDPRKAKLVDVRRVIRWSIAPIATLADALSTAFMVMPKSDIRSFCKRTPGVQALFVED